jgi:excisionase family DNA binding protein
MMNELSDFLSVREVAVKLNYHPATVYGLIKKGELEVCRIGEGRTIRIPASAVTRLLSGNKQGGVTA